MTGTPGTNTGHGHVWPRPDGVKMRCGGPGLCPECSADAARLPIFTGRDAQGFRVALVDDRLIVSHPDAAPVVLRIVNGVIQIVPPLDPYRDDRYPSRPCDKCGQAYRGPAVYCSLACAQADA